MSGGIYGDLRVVHLKRVLGRRGGFKSAEGAASVAGKVASQVPSSVGDVSGTGEADRLPGISGIRGSGVSGFGAGVPLTVLLHSRVTRVLATSSHNFHTVEFQDRKGKLFSLTAKR